MRLLKFILFIIIMLMFGGLSYGQSIYPVGYPSQLSYQKGGYGADSLLAIPYRDTTPSAWTSYRKVGRITLRPQDGLMYINDGTAWKALASAPTGYIPYPDTLRGTGHISTYTYFDSSAYVNSRIYSTLFNDALLSGNISKDSMGGDGIQMVTLNGWWYSLGRWNGLGLPIGSGNNSDSLCTFGRVDNLSVTDTFYAPWHGRHCFGAGVRNDSVFVFGGDGTEYPNFNANDCWVATQNVSTGRLTWHQVASNVPALRAIMSGRVVTPVALLQLGGHTFNGSTYPAIDTIFASYDGGVTWQVVQTGVTQLGKNIANSAVYYPADSHVYIISGGTYDDGSGRTYNKQVYRCNADGTGLELYDTIPFPSRQFPAQTTIYNGYICYGYGANGSGYLNDLWLYKPELKQWQPFSYKTAISARDAPGLVGIRDSNGFQSLLMQGGSDPTSQNTLYRIYENGLDRTVLAGQQKWFGGTTTYQNGGGGSALAFGSAETHLSVGAKLDPTTGGWVRTSGTILPIELSLYNLGMLIRKSTVGANNSTITWDSLMRLTVGGNVFFKGTVTANIVDDPLPDSVITTVNGEFRRTALANVQPDISGKVNYTDTTGMLAHYLKAIDTTNKWYNKQLPLVLDNTGGTASRDLLFGKGATSQTGDFYKFVNSSNTIIAELKSGQTGGNPSFIYGDATNGSNAANMTWNGTAGPIWAGVNRNNASDVTSGVNCLRLTSYEYMTGGIKQFGALDFVGTGSTASQRRGFFRFVLGVGASFGQYQQAIIGTYSTTLYNRMLVRSPNWADITAYPFNNDSIPRAYHFIDLYSGNGASNADTALTISSDDAPTTSAINILKRGTGQTFAVDFNGTVNSGGTADASAQMTVTSTTKGFLPPRMTGAQAEAITSPADGLMIYCNNGNGATVNAVGIWAMIGGTWTKL